jgi:hypothetical protein
MQASQFWFRLCRGVPRAGWPQAGVSNADGDLTQNPKFKLLMPKETRIPNGEMIFSAFWKSAHGFSQQPSDSEFGLEISFGFQGFGLRNSG